MDIETDPEIELTITSAKFVGTCFRCGEPTTGTFVYGYSDAFQMTCVNCNAKSILELRGADNNFIFPLIGGDNA